MTPSIPMSDETLAFGTVAHFAFQEMNKEGRKFQMTLQVINM